MRTPLDQANKVEGLLPKPGKPNSSRNWAPFRQSMTSNVPTSRMPQTVDYQGCQGQPPYCIIK